MQELNVKPHQFETGNGKTPDQSKCKLKFDYSPSSDNVNYNLLILLHGLGDTKGPFGKLGPKLNLPQTATLAVQAPDPVPYLEDSYQWFPSFDFLTGELLTPAHPERLKGLTRTRQYMTELLLHLINDCGYDASRIFFFGFSQGGTVALDTVLFGDIRNIGGVVSISGYLLEEQRNEKKKGDGYGGYILITQGEKDSVVGKKADAQKKFEVVKKMCSSNAITSQVFISNKEHTMPSSQAEWRVIHTFFAEHMPRRNLELENMADVYLVSSNPK